MLNENLALHFFMLPTIENTKEILLLLLNQILLSHTQMKLLPQKRHLTQKESPQWKKKRIQRATSTQQRRLMKRLQQQKRFLSPQKAWKQGKKPLGKKKKKNNLELNPMFLNEKYDLAVILLCTNMFQLSFHGWQASHSTLTPKFVCLFLYDL